MPYVESVGFLFLYFRIIIHDETWYIPACRNDLKIHLFKKNVHLTAVTIPLRL